jgi:hypothetical protein
MTSEPRHYLFGGEDYYPSAPPGDLILVGTLEQCRAMAVTVADRGYIHREGGIGGTPVFTLPENSDDFSFMRMSIEWWRILNADMEVVEHGADDNPYGG